MNLRKQTEITNDFTKKLLDLISKTNKQLRNIDKNSSISNIYITYLPCYAWADSDRISLKVSIKTDSDKITNNNISNFSIEITEK